jgi:hypothetical protein
MILELVTTVKPDEEITDAFVKVISILKEIQHGGYCESNIILQKFYEKGISNLDGEIAYLIKVGEILGIDFDTGEDFEVEIVSEDDEDDDGLPF